MAFPLLSVCKEIKNGPLLSIVSGNEYRKRLLMVISVAWSATGLILPWTKGVGDSPEYQVS